MRPLVWVAPVAAYIGAIVAANWLTVRYGFIAVAPGLAAIGAGAILSWFLASPALAIASGAAFVFSETTDWAIYTPLRRRGWVRAAFAGNVAGFMVDTFLFLWLAHFAILANAPGQLLGKSYATALYLVLGIGVSRALSRVPVHADAA